MYPAVLNLWRSGICYRNHLLYHLAPAKLWKQLFVNKKHFPLPSEFLKLYLTVIFWFVQIFSIEKVLGTVFLLVCNFSICIKSVFSLETNFLQVLSIFEVLKNGICHGNHLLYLFSIHKAVKITFCK